MSKLTIMAAFGAGYVLGARAGRERYDQIASKSRQVWRDPRVQRKASQAQDVAAHTASQAASVVGEKAVHAAASVQETVKDKISGDSADAAQTASAGAGSDVAMTTPPPPAR
jgi:hypothetical protein